MGGDAESDDEDVDAADGGEVDGGGHVGLLFCVVVGEKIAGGERPDVRESVLELGCPEGKEVPDEHEELIGIRREGRGGREGDG